MATRESAKSGKTRSGHHTPMLSDVLRVENDPSLQLAGINVEDGVVRVKFKQGNAIHVKLYTCEEARRVVADLIAWTDARKSPA